ncbi:MAG: hypothetical protein ISS25_03310 [Nanoarchaeota archaeon]|nr:hypothetical protein [DPANN group archaeon]MBL7116830.1 hypothetical protein [Nanoarchaeota archaeon]
MSWYEELGYKQNPLEIDSFKIDFIPIKYEKEIEELVYRLKAGNVVMIEGPDGSGKTTLLKETIRRFGGRGKVIYFDNKQLGRNLNIEDLLVNSQNFFRRLVGKKPVNMILLLDNVNYLTKRNSERIKYFFDQNYLKGVAFTTDRYKNVKFTKSMKDRIGKRVIKLSPPTVKEVVMITKDRLLDEKLLSDRMIKKIFNLSKANLKQHLANCKAVLEYLVDNDKDSINDQEVVRVVSKVVYEEEDLTKNCYACDGPLERIKGNWRCPNCETYCLKCSTIVSDKDEKCGECGMKFEG